MSRGDEIDVPEGLRVAMLCLVAFVIAFLAFSGAL